MSSTWETWKDPYAAYERKAQRAAARAAVAAAQEVANEEAPDNAQAESAPHQP